MFLGLKAPLKQGQQVPVTLTFEHTGVVKVALDVQSVGALAACTTSKFRDGKIGDARRR
jgi:copper(I)-binding protein